MADDFIIEGNPKYEALYRQWVREGNPGWLTIGSQTYKVVQNVEGKYEFRPVSNESLYTSTGI